MSGNPPDFNFKPERNSAELSLQARDEAYSRDDYQSAPTSLGVELPFDPVRILMATQRFWYLPVIAGLILGALAFWIGIRFLHTTYTDELMLVPNEVPTNLRANEFGESYKPQEMDPGTFMSMIFSRRVLAATCRHPSLNGLISVNDLKDRLSMEHDRKTGILRVTYTTRGGRKEVMAVLSAFGKEVENLTRQLQIEEARDVATFMDRQLQKAEADHGTNRNAIRIFLESHGYLNADLELEADLRTRNDIQLRLQSAGVEVTTIDFKIDSLLRILRSHHPLFTRLDEARARLETLRQSFTDQNPLVVSQLENIAGIEARIDEHLDSADEAQASPQFTRDGFTNAVMLDLVNARSRKASLEAEIQSLRDLLKSMEGKMSRLPGLSQEYLKLKTEDERLQVLVDLLKARKREAEMFIDEVIPAYRAYESAVYDSVRQDSPMKPLLAIVFFGMAFGSTTVFLIIVFLELLNDRVVTVGDLRRLTRLEVLAGLTDLTPRRGRKDTGKWSIALWKRLEARLERRCANRSIITITSLHRNEGKTTWIAHLSQAACVSGQRVIALVNECPAGQDWHTLQIDRFLEHPRLALEKAEENDQSKRPKPVAIILPREWVWHSRNRELWLRALSEIHFSEPASIFVEINEPMKDENMLFMSQGENVFWLSRSNGPKYQEIQGAMKIMRSMNTRLRGAFINRLPALFEQLPMATKSFSWIICLTGIFAGLMGSGDLHGSEPWRLGPGDVLDISLYANPGSMRKGVTISPDGRLSYLQAHGIRAAGMTVDELREHISRQLSEFYRPSQAVVIPQAFRSRQYSIMGAVREPGNYVLDKPVSILQAVARAGGLRTALFDDRNVEVADLSKAFLSRNGRQIPIDFDALINGRSSEADFELQHGDYLFFPSMPVREIYLTGAVVSPGRVVLTGELTLTRLVAHSGGFLEDARLSQVLVIRGSLAAPTPHVVDVGDVLSGRAPDFPLEAGDYVFVPDRPWKELKTVMDLATRAFIGGAVSTFATDQVPAVIRR